MVLQIIQGTFPNYSQLIPQTYGTKARIDVAEFQRAIEWHPSSHVTAAASHA